MEPFFKKPLLFLLACVIVASCLFLFSGAYIRPYQVNASSYALSGILPGFGNATAASDGEAAAEQQHPACPTSTPRKLVLFAAKARTGSTFIGELFNQNPNVFYLFEPLRVIPDMVKMDAIPETYRGDMSAELVNSFYHCDFLTYFAYEIQRWGLAIYESKALQKICRSRRQCKDVPISRLKQECSNYDVMVIKSIRVDDLGYIVPLLERECFDLQVVLLVRDPRAVASSRKHFKFHYSSYRTLQELGIARPVNDKTTELHPSNVHDYCGWLERNIAVLENVTARARSRITVLRYEDVVANVTQKALDLHELFGVTPTDDVLRWISDNTRSKEEVTRGSMITKRNSTKTAQAWRSDLRIHDVELVQGACGDVIQKLGYKLIDRESELTDMSTLLLNPQPSIGEV
ncbi:carbohydrate sulfotransferase 3-like [Ptychodera flava]|uniref:carbohydrate sulfotransferase 3-like n=1 Tax=Ptychodera flava TaxID=63121 RepID=UPI00396A01EB